MNRLLIKRYYVNNNIVLIECIDHQFSKKKKKKRERKRILKEYIPDLYLLIQENDNSI